LQVFLEAVNRHVRDGQQMVELDAVLFAQVLLVIGFELRLRRWKRRADRIVDQV